MRIIKSRWGDTKLELRAADLLSPEFDSLEKIEGFMIAKSISWVFIEGEKFAALKTPDTGLSLSSLKECLNFERLKRIFP